MYRYSLLVAGFLCFANGVSAQYSAPHTYWYYYAQWPHYGSPAADHGGWHFWKHHEFQKKGPPAFHKKGPPPVTEDREVVELLKKLLERLERGQPTRPPSAVEKARAEVHAAEDHLAAAKANLARIESPRVELPRMIGGPPPHHHSHPHPAPTALQRLERLQQELDELRRDLKRDGR